MTLNVGVVGVGKIGQEHIRRLTETLVGARVVAVSDADATRADGLKMVFVHQPPFADRCDGWEMPTYASDAFAAAVAGCNISLIASGHRHCAASLTIGEHRTMWAPSLPIPGESVTSWLHEQDADDVQPGTGVLEYRLFTDGRFEVRTVPLAGSEAMLHEPVTGVDLA